MRRTLISLGFFVIWAPLVGCGGMPEGTTGSSRSSTSAGGTSCKGVCCQVPSRDQTCNSVPRGQQTTAWDCGGEMGQTADINHMTNQQCVWLWTPEWAGFCCVAAVK